MEAEKEVFLHGNKAAFEAGKDKNYAPGCVANGIPESIAQEIWAQMEKFASYAFNRSHAACYAWIANITAYMACHWGPEFYCAMMNAFEDIGDKVKGYMALAVKRGIKILPPDINKSTDRCTVDDGCIRLGFHTLTHLNKFSRLIIRERKANGPFTDCQDFYERMTDLGKKPSKNILQSLIYSGAMDCFGLNRNQMVAMIPILENDYKKNATNRALGQVSLFAPSETRVPAPEVPEFDDKFLMEKEKEAIGFYLTKHPVDELYANGSNADCVPITDLLASDVIPDGEDVWISTFAIIRDIRSIYTKKEEEMFFFVAEDRFNEVQCVLFPKRVAANKHRLEEGALVKLVGYYRVDEQRGPQIQVQEILNVDEAKAAGLSSVTITVQNREEQDALMKFIGENPGKAIVKLRAKNRIYDTKKAIKLTPAALDFLREHFLKVET